MHHVPELVHCSQSKQQTNRSTSRHNLYSSSTFVMITNKPRHCLHRSRALRGSREKTARTAQMGSGVVVPSSYLRTRPFLQSGRLDVILGMDLRLHSITRDQRTVVRVPQLQCNVYVPEGTKSAPHFIRAKRPTRPPPTRIQVTTTKPTTFRCSATLAGMTSAQR